jgi:SAM-dependent methyltransferase
MRVNVGCGQSPIPGWRNFDNSLTIRLAAWPGVLPVFCGLGLLGPSQAAFGREAVAAGVEWADASRLPLASQSAEVVYSSHMFEHLDRARARAFLSEARRVLKPGGRLRLAVPDLERLASAYLADGDADTFVERLLLATEPPSALRDVLRQLIVGPRNHLWMYDGRSLSALLSATGFVDVQTLPPGATHITDSEPLNLFERADESIYVEATRPL